MENWASTSSKTNEKEESAKTDGETIDDDPVVEELILEPAREDELEALDTDDLEMIQFEDTTEKVLLEKDDQVESIAPIAGEAATQRSTTKKKRSKKMPKQSSFTEHDFFDDDFYEVLLDDEDYGYTYLYDEPRYVDRYHFM